MSKRLAVFSSMRLLTIVLFVRILFAKPFWIPSATAAALKSEFISDSLVLSVVDSPEI